MSGTANQLLDIAKGELGVKENPAGSNKVKYNTWFYGQEVSGPGYPWCMAFVQWCFDRAGIPLPRRTASCGDLMRAAQTAGCWVAKHYQPGDVVIYDFPGGAATDHCGIVERVQDGTVTAIEGNTSYGNDSNGGQVMRRTRPTSQIVGAVRPAFKTGTKEDDDMDVNRFRELWAEMRRELQDNDSGGYSQAARRWAVDSGLVQGGGKTADGESNYMWEDVLTREQMVTVLYRFAKLTGLA